MIIYKFRSAGPLLLIILLCFMTACKSSPETNNARAIKISMLEELRNDTASDIREACKLIDSMPLATDKDCRNLYLTFNRITFDLHQQGNDARAIPLLNHARDILDNSDNRSSTDTKELINIHVRLGATFSDMGMPALSVDYYLQGLDFCTDSIYDEYKAMLYNNLGIIYAERQMLERAEKYFLDALAINKRKQLYDNMSLNYGNLTELYALQGNIEKALETSQLGLDFVNQKNHPEQLARMRVYQGSLYARSDQPDVALTRYKSALKQYGEIDYKRGKVDALLHIAEVWLGEEQPDSAMVYARHAYDICRANTRDDDMVATLKTLADISRSKGDYRHALDLLTEQSSLSDSLRNAESRLRLTNWPVGNTRKSSADRTFSHTTITWLLITTLTLLGTTILLLTFLIKQRRESRDKITEADAKETQLTKEIDELRRRMTSLSLDKIKLHEGLSDLSEGLRTVLTEMSPRESEKRETLRNVLRRVDNMTAFDADEEFKLFFEGIHPDFYSTLSDRFPELTPRDMRLCAFLLLGMTTKEIAVLTYREIRSVDSARNRLRKKLGIDVNDDLTTYLRSI